MKLILVLTDQEAAELLEASSEEGYVSQMTYLKVRAAIESVTTEDEFKTIEAFDRNYESPSAEYIRTEGV